MKNDLKQTLNGIGRYVDIILTNERAFVRKFATKDKAYILDIYFNTEGVLFVYMKDAPNDGRVHFGRVNVHDFKKWGKKVTGNAGKERKQR